MDHIELEHYKCAMILTKDEAWDRIVDSNNFNHQVYEYMEYNGVDFDSAFESVLTSWEFDGIDILERYYTRIDGLIEHDISGENSENLRILSRGVKRLYPLEE